MVFRLYYRLHYMKCRVVQNTWRTLMTFAHRSVFWWGRGMMWASVSFIKGALSSSESISIKKYGNELLQPGINPHAHSLKLYFLKTENSFIVQMMMTKEPAHSCDSKPHWIRVRSTVGARGTNYSSWLIWLKKKRWLKKAKVCRTLWPPGGGGVFCSSHRCIFLTNVAPNKKRNKQISKIRCIKCQKAAKKKSNTNVHALIQKNNLRSLNFTDLIYLDLLVNQFLLMSDTVTK